MATIKAIKRRTKAASNIAQITKAMEMVAASKMRRAQEKALSSRPYAGELAKVLKRMAALVDPEAHVLFRTPEPQDANTVAILTFSSDKGLCGSLNTNLFKTLEALEDAVSEEHPNLIINPTYITVGKKAREYVLKTGRTLHAEFIGLPDRPAYEDILPIAKLLLDEFTSGRFFKVYLLYTDFVSTINQKPSYERLLPLKTETTLSEGESATEPHFDYVFEPSSSVILEWLLPYYFELTVYQKLLEAQASEHSSRMVAMRNASENAKDIVRYLKLQYNQKRQAAITNEIADIVTSRLAVE